MNKIDQLDKLLYGSVGQHGYWLVNNQDIILEDITFALNKYGYLLTAELLNKIDSPFVVNLYKKIEEKRNAYTNA